jgi:DNA replication protein DnaC
MTSMQNFMNEDSNFIRTVIDETREPKICPYCGKKLYYVRYVLFGQVREAGHYETCECEGAVKAREEEERRKEEEEKRKREIETIARLFEKSNIGERFKNRTFETFNPDQNLKAYQIALDYAENFEKYAQEGQGIIFMSKQFGVGKTHLAAAIANYLITKKHIPVIFGTLIGLLGEIKKTYDEDSIYTTAQVESKLRDVPLLIIDDLGKEKVSDWVLEKFYSIVNYRYENYKPMIITTNLTLEEIEEKFDNTNGYIGGAIVSRLIEMCRIMKMEGEDYRKIMKKRGVANALY